MTIPVALALERRNIRTTHLALTTAAEPAKKAGLETFGFRDLVKLPRDRPALALGEELASGLPQGGVVSRAETVAYLGLCFAELAADFGESMARKNYARAGRQAFLPVKSLRQAIHETGADLVVATNAPRAERAAILAAGQLNVPSVCLIDLFGGAALQWISEPGFGSRVCVLSTGVRQKLVAMGRNGSEIIVTGNPAFDRLAQSSLAEEGTRMRRARGWSEKRVVLYASQVEAAFHPFNGQKGNTTLPAAVEAELTAMASELKDVVVVVRPHPSEQRNSRSVEPPLQFSGPDDEIAVLLNAVDLVVTFTSTVGLEAALLGKPVIAVRGSVFEQDMPLAEMGIALSAEVGKSLRVSIEQAIGAQCAIPEGLPEIGSATSRVTDVISGLLDE